jgi:hypothetical protein
MANGIALLNNDKNKRLYDDLFKNKPDYSIVSSSPKIFSAIHKDDFNEDFYLSDSELDAYIEGFLDTIEENIEGVITNVNEEDSSVDFEESALDDDDIKLSLYRSFKSLYDKWISNSGDSSVEGDIGYFFNNYGLNDSRSLYDHFKFINRVGKDVGGVAVIDPSYLTNIGSNTNGEGPTQSLYQVMTNLLGKNNFDFWPTPSNNPILTNDLTNEEAEDMFRPIDSPIVINNSGPMYNCVYVGGSSRTLKDLNSKDGGCNLINNQYQDDSFDLGDPTGTDWPEEFKNTDSNILLFKVRYGQESQSHFYGVELDQTEFKETQESLSIIDKLTNPKKGSSPSQYGKGNSMFDLYLTRSYNCRVSSLGNMSIQPLLYFKLENVPMFRGTYLINEVTHKITENKIETTFNGLRQPKITIPIVKDPISILDLVVSEQEGEGSDGTFDLDEGGTTTSTKTFAVIEQYGGQGLEPLTTLVITKESGGDYEIYNFGTSGSGGIRSYTSTSPYYSSSAIQLTNKTVREILQYQSNHQMFAVGKYQLIPVTLKSVATKLNLLDSKFDKTTQDTLGNYLFIGGKRPSLAKYLKGENGGSVTELENAVQDLGQEFASMPIIFKDGVKWGDVEAGTGNKGYYGGKGPNPDSVKENVGTIANVIIKSRIQYSEKEPSFTPSYYKTT